MPPVARPVAGSTSKTSGPIRQVFDLVRKLLLDRRYYFHLVELLSIGELLLGLLILRYVPYTKIDWDAYMQQVEGFLSGERDYSKLEGETGPIVYPALFLYIYTALHRYLPAHNRIRLAQYLFLGLYQVTFLLVSTIYYRAGSDPSGSRRSPNGTPRIVDTHSEHDTDQTRNTPVPSAASQTAATSRYPQLLLIPLCLSKRLHSIYMLRLFNDPFGMVLLYAAVIAFMTRTRGAWRTGSVLYSLALGVKMNHLLYLPGLLVLLVQYRGIFGTIESIIIISSIQLLLPSPYFLTSGAHARSYFTTAFEFSRQFKYEWTVNWRFISEGRFLSRGWAVGLLFGHISCLILFAFYRWSPVRGGSLTVLKRATSQPARPGISPGELSSDHIPLVLFTSNLIGMAFARSIHYQFHCWYFHQIPFLLFAIGSRYNIPILVILWLGIEYAWSTFPSTVLSSRILSLCHATIILNLLLAPRISRAPAISDDMDMKAR